MAYVDNIRKQLRHNRLYIQREIERDEDFKMPMRVAGIVQYINGKYGVEKDARPLSRTSLNRYYKIGIDKQKSVGTPLSIPMVLLNAMRLYIKVLQLSKRGQASGQIIKGKLVASASGTEHEGFDPDWAWRQIRELWPDEIAPISVSQQESIMNEWTTHTKVND